MQGKVVHTWESKYIAGQVAYLLENGHLLRAAQLPAEERLFGGPQAGGRLQEFTWEGELIWDFKFHNEKQIPHHDIAKLPNGNVLLLVWEKKTADETIAAGRSPEYIDGPWLVELGDRDQAYGKNHRGNCLGVARLGSFDSGSRFVLAELRQREWPS